jgi:hypothetical protein
VRDPIAGVVLTISVLPSGKVQLKVVERAAVEFGTRGNIESQEHLDGCSAKHTPHSTGDRLQPHLEDSYTMNPCNHRYASA